MKNNYQKIAFRKWRLYWRFVAILRLMIKYIAIDRKESTYQKVLSKYYLRNIELKTRVSIPIICRISANDSKERVRTNCASDLHCISTALKSIMSLWYTTNHEVERRILCTFFIVWRTQSIHFDNIIKD
jgi:hypothetical protein